MKYARLVMFGMILLLTACGASYDEIEPNMSRSVNDFEFTTESNESLSLEDLKGDWWIADFIFTNCETVCLPMTYHMSELQNRLADNGLDIRLISFSVDPDYDTPEVLTAYAEEYAADLSNWSFLTNYDFQTIKELSIKSFQAALKEPERGSDQVLHDTRFFLVSPEGETIKGYDGLDINSLDEIIDDLLVLHSN
ncbi:SCO family protein [Ornithinibacillus sp. 4-3]|uniref:SCO family protein n=1 Tax=Ornithinibacillus sp. 4-3 TaxID=3231488 RepID=A0AB39HT18_9BACI